MNDDGQLPSLFDVVHWQSVLNRRPLCGGPADAMQVQERAGVTCASCLWHLQEARKRRARG